MIRKYLWNQAGGFDNRYSPAYCEDSDLAFMVRQMGYKVIYQPLSEVIHFEGFSHGKDTVLKKKKKSIKSFQEINKSKFYDKWKDSLLKYQLPNAQNVSQDTSC